jgi:hypothetical protein
MAKRLPKKDRWMDDGDDARFEPVKKSGSKRKVSSKTAPKMKAKGKTTSKHLFKKVPTAK